MEITPECVPCLLKRVIFEAEACCPDKVADAVGAALKVFADKYTGREVSAELATDVHRAAYKAMGNMDPYKQMKERANEAAAAMVPKAARLVDGSDDPLHAAIRVSIIGNIMDFGIEGIGGPEELEKEFDRLFLEELGRDDTEKFRHILKKGARILLFTDNCGEILFDAILATGLKRTGAEVIMVVKGEPILTDATREDVEAYGIDESVDRVMDTGHFAVGVDFNRIGDELRDLMEGPGRADLIISKGMANFESFSSYNYRPITYLMRSKCGPVSRAADVPFNRSVVVFKD